MHARWGSGRRFRVLIAVIAAHPLLTHAAQAANVAPTISGTPPTTATPGETYVFQAGAHDADADRLSFSATGVPRWARFDKKAGRLHGTPSQRDLGASYTIKVSVSDGKLSAALAPFVLEVVPRGNPPVISGTPATAGREKELYTFLPAASDPDGDTLTFSIANKPSWATFTASSGLLSGIPPAGSAGTYSNITIAVSDGTSKRSLPAFGIVVATAANSAPKISGVPPASVTAGQGYAFRPTASDADGQTLRFSITQMPAWASFDVATGALGGTPSNAQAGTYSSIVISVTDGLATASLSPFSITVTATNAPPKISGSPPTAATVGVAYSFTPTASDPEGKTLSFSISGKPAWAKFDTATGKLYGTPTDSNVGTTSGIVIAASDGQDTAALPSFSIAVGATADRSAALSWLPPTSNVDGTPLTNLAGYRIAYGQSSSSLSQSLSIPHPDVTSAVIENLAAGTWYFAVKAYTTTGVESDLSNLAQKTLN